MKALKVTWIKTVGADRDRPAKFGNCFGVVGDDGEGYSIVNFYHENLEYLLVNGLTWPVEYKVISPHVAVIDDTRIGERWYNTHYCELCCPKRFLNSYQLQRIERDIRRGIREERSGYVTVKVGSNQGVEYP